MLSIRNLAVLVVGLIFVGGALFGLDFSNAQQTPPVTDNQKSSVLPSPTVSPSPEIIEEDDEVIKIDTEAVNMLFTAQDRNRRLLTELKQTDVRICLLYTSDAADE